MTTLTDLSTLLTRLEAATGPDRELDDLIAVRVARIKPTTTYGHELLGNLREAPNRSPLYTASLDAALALVEGVLPASNGYDLSFVRGNDKPYDVRLYGTDGAEVAVFEADAWTPALALLTALVRALSQEGR